MGLYQRSGTNLLTTLTGSELIGIDTGTGTLNNSCTVAAIAALSTGGAAIPVGVIANGRVLSDVTTTAGSPVISSASYNFQPSDIGKLITIAGAGSSSAVLNATITFINFQGGAILNPAPGTSIAGTGTATFVTDSTAALQAAVVPGATLLLPIGIVGISAPILWANNVSVFGWGGGKSILKWISTTDMTNGMIYNEVGSPYLNDCQFRNFEMDMEAATNTSGYQVLASAIRIQAAQRAIVDGCYIHGSPASPLAFDFGEQVQITHNDVQNCGRFAISTSQGGAFGVGCAINSGTVQSFLISDNIFTAPASANSTYGVFFEAEVSGQNFNANIVVANNTFIGVGTKAAIGDCGSRRALIIGNHIEINSGNTGSGIAVQGGTTGFAPGEQGLIAYNTITSLTGSGIVIDYTVAEPAGQFCGYDIVGNKIQNMGAHGILVRANASTVLATLNLTNNDIQGCTFNGMTFVGAGGFSNLNLQINKCWNNGTGGSGITACGFAFESAISALSMIGNRAYDNGTGTQKYGIGFNTGVVFTNSVVQDNNLTGNATAAILQTGATLTNCLLKDNPGYNPVGTGAVAPGASPWTYTAGSSPETIYLAASTSITALTQGGSSILPIATSANGQIAVQLDANAVLVSTYTGTMTAARWIH